eukprot:81091_1
MSETDLIENLKIICQSPHVHPFISTFKKYCGDDKYNPHGQSSNSKNFILREERRSLYFMLEELEQINIANPPPEAMIVEPQPPQMNDTFEELTLLNKVQKIAIDRKEKTIRELEEKIVHLQN